MTQSIATGAKLTAATWEEFVGRLKRDVTGEGYGNDWHYTRDPVFTVEKLVYDYGVDADYGGEMHVCDDETVYTTPMAYYLEASKATQRALDECARENGWSSFASGSDDVQLEWVEEVGEARVVGRKGRWEYLNNHFTKDAADAFISRKKHDYRDGLRVYVECSAYCWELNAIREAILSGKLRFVDE